MAENKETTPQSPQGGKVEKDEKSKLKEEIDNIGKKKFGKFQDYAVFRKNLDSINNNFGENGLKLLQIILESGNFDNDFLLKDSKKFFDHLKEKGYINDLFENLGEEKGKLTEVLKALKENYELGQKKETAKKEGEQLTQRQDKAQKEGEKLIQKENEATKETNRLSTAVANIGSQNNIAATNNTDTANNIGDTNEMRSEVANSIDRTDDFSKRIAELKRTQPEYFDKNSGYEEKKQQHIQRLTADPKFQQTLKSFGKYAAKDIPALAELCATKEVIATTDISQKSPELTQQIVGDYNRLNAQLGLNANSLNKLGQDTELKNTNKSVQRFLSTDRIQGLQTTQATDDKLKQIFGKKDGATPSAEGQPTGENGQTPEGEKTSDEFEKKKAELFAKINVSSNNEVFNAFTGRIGDLFNILSSSIPGGKINNQISYDRDKFMLESDKGIEFDGDINGKKFNFEIDEKGDFKFTDYFADKQGSIGIDTKKLNNMFRFVPLSEYENITTTVLSKLNDIIKDSNSEEEILEKLNAELQKEAEKLKKDAVVAKAELGFEMNRFVNGTNYIPFFKPPNATKSYEYKGDASNELKIDAQKDKSLFEYMKLVKDTMNTLPTNENSQIIASLTQIEEYSKTNLSVFPNPNPLDNLDSDIHKEAENSLDPNSDLLQSFQEDSKPFESEIGFIGFIQKFKTNKNGVEVLDAEKLQKFVDAMQKKERFVNTPNPKIETKK